MPKALAAEPTAEDAKKDNASQGVAVDLAAFEAAARESSEHDRQKSLAGSSMSHEIANA